MIGHDSEIEKLRDRVHCAVVLERTPPPWKLDRKESKNLRDDTRYAATGGGIGRGTIRARGDAREHAMLPGALFCSATDANGPGDRFADRHRSLAKAFGILFIRLRPLIEGEDWNNVLKSRAQREERA
jgi:hypothetical protein